jgi:hypothetical protein
MLARLYLLLTLLIVGCDSSSKPPAEPLQFDADQATEEVMNEVMSTPQGRAEVERIGGKDVALTRFQEANGISEKIAEAAIKEWMLTHAGNFDWDLEDVKRMCLRNKQSGIPHEYLPESEK